MADGTDGSKPQPVSAVGIPPVGDPSPGRATRQVDSARVRTVEFNHFGQYSILIGAGLALALAAVTWAGGFNPYRGVFVYGSLFCFACQGFYFGLRGYNASVRGLATNPTTSVVGMVLTAAFIAAETAWILVHHL